MSNKRLSLVEIKSILSENDAVQLRCPVCPSQRVKATRRPAFAEIGKYSERNQSYEGEAELEEYACLECKKLFYI